MKVKCVICDKIESLEDDSFQAKRLRNRPIYTYMCQTCNERITKNTEARIATGKFQFHRPQPEEEDW